MRDLKATLTEIIQRPIAAGGTAAGMAVVVGATGESGAAWVPASTRDEPAFLIFSITKTFIAVLMLLLRDEGHLALSDPLARWFPSITASDHISLRQPLNHTAGLPDYGNVSAYHEELRASPSRPWSFERFAAETFEKGRRYEPGTGWAYSNVGYMLLRRILEDVSGEPFAVLLSDRILRRLDLRRTFVPQSLEDLAALAPALSRALAPDGSPRDVRDHYHPGWVSHGVVASTPSDVARFLDALFRGRLLSPEALEEMTTLVPVPQDQVSQPTDEPYPWVRPSYGLGIQADPESRGGRVWGHNGEGPGYRTSAFHAPDLGGISACAMCAVEGEFRTSRLVFAALDALRTI